MLHTSVMLLASQGLLDFNPASHGVWLVAYLLGGVVVINFALDVVDRLWDRVVNRRSRSGGLEGDRPEEPHAGPPADGFHVHSPDSELRHRHYSEPPKVGRDRRPNEPEKRLD